MAPPMRRKAVQKQDEIDENSTPQHNFEGDFFQFVSLSWYVLVASAFTLVVMLCFHPDLIPYHHLGPVGNVLFSLKENHRKTILAGCRVLMLIHGIEAFAVYRLCRRLKFTMPTTIKWTLQTIFLGFASYGIILKYSTERGNYTQANEKKST